jgi:hypothetical protein
MSSSHPTTREVLLTPRPCGPEQDRLEEQFFQHVVLKNGTFKTTSARRLDDLNQFCVPFLREIAVSPLEIMDVAVSSGISTVEWIEHLGQCGLAHEMTATDLCVDATLNSVGSVAALYDRTGNLLHVDILGHGLAGRAEGWRRPFFAATRQFVVAVLSGALALGLKPIRDAVRLLSTRLVDYPHLQVIEDDLSLNRHCAFQRAFHVIRAANVLNRAYFSEPVLRQMLNNLRQRLKDNGLLIICRTTSDGINKATIFRAVKGDRLVPLAQLRGGVEVEPFAVTDDLPAKSCGSV